MNTEFLPIETTFDRFIANAKYPERPILQMLWSLEAAKRMLLQARVQNFTGADVVRVASELRTVEASAHK